MEKSKLTRRQFLQVAAAGVGASALTGTGLYRWKKDSPLALIKTTKFLLGTGVTITVEHPETVLAERAISKAFAAIEKVDRVMSIHRPDSDLARVNAAAGRDAIPVDSSLCEILELARDFYQQTGGAYDVTCLPLMRLYGFYSGAQRLEHYPTDREIYAILDAVGQKNIVMDVSRQTVGIARKGCAIDLGSIGKGYAVDQAVAILRQEGIENALVDAGGNLFAMGTPKHQPEGWQIAIRNPEGSKENPYFETIPMTHKGVATSGNYEQSVWLAGRKVGHLFDMRSGKPANRGISATVVAANATLADVLSTATFVFENRDRLAPLAEKIFYHG